MIDAHDELLSLFFANEPEYTNGLIRIMRSKEVVPGIIRTLAMQALGAHLAADSSSHERARVLSGSGINFAEGNCTILLNVLQKVVSSLNASNDPSSLSFVEAILQFYLLHIISSSNSGGVIRGSGVVTTFLPLLEDSKPGHMHLVCFAVKTLQKLMDYSHIAVSLFKDLGGVELLAQRLQIEVTRVMGLAGLRRHTLFPHILIINHAGNIVFLRLSRVIQTNQLIIQRFRHLTDRSPQSNQHTPFRYRRYRSSNAFNTRQIDNHNQIIILFYDIAASF